MMALNKFMGSADLAEPSLAPLQDDDDDESSAFTRIDGASSVDEDLLSYDSLSLVTFGTKERTQQPVYFRENQDQAPLPREVVSRNRELSDRRADEVRSVFADPYMWRYLDHFQIECLGSADCFDTSLPSMKVQRNDPWMWFESESRTLENTVVMKVEATALSEYDISSGMRQHEVPGSNAVGVVHHCSPGAEDEGVKPGMRVAAILQPGGANARYFSLPSSEVLPVGRHLDASDVACISTAYLPAFQALHHGRVRPYRYSRTCLEGRNIFIVGGDQLVAQATVRLAQLAGAKHVYISAPRCMVDPLQKIDAFVLDEDPCQWPDVMEGAMDVVIDYRFPKNFTDVKATVSRKGRLVCCTPTHWKKEENLSWPDLTFQILQLSFSVKRATFFDFRQNYKTSRYELKEDLQFLLTALTRRQIRPQIDKYVKLADAPQVYREMKLNPTAGSIICEPWRD